MRRLKIRLPIRAAIVLFIVTFAGFGTTIASAAPSGTSGAQNTSNKGSGNGLRVSPVRTDLTVNPGKTQTLTITVTNVTSLPATLQTVVNDFIANPNETGNPSIILDPTKFAPNHSLKRFVGPVGDFTLAPGQQKGVVITINVPANAAGGGYYGAIRFAPAGSLGGNPNISLAGSVGSLILLKVPGNIKEQLSIAGFDARVNDSPNNFFTSNKNITANIRFQNLGNIQEEPFGKVLLKNRNGKILATYEVNSQDPPGNVLPDSIRRFSVPVNGVGKFGQFKLEGNFGYGSGGQLLSASTTFYIIPLSLIIAAVALILLIIFLIFGLPRLIRNYNRRILRRAGRR